MAISLRQLEYFVTVIDEGSFTRAAELLEVSQPGLSHQIQALERELGGPLLERSPRRSGQRSRPDPGRGSTRVGRLGRGSVGFIKLVTRKQSAGSAKVRDADA
jgi:hypothetical protein